MNLESLVTKPVLALITVAALTTVFGRRNSAAVFDSLGRALSSTISASLGSGANVA